MGEQYIQLPADSTGGKQRTLEETINSQTVQSHHVVRRTGECYWLFLNNMTVAASKIYVAMLNGSGSGKTAYVHSVVNHVNTGGGTVTGGSATWLYKRITAISGGTTATPIKINSDNANIPAQFTFVTAPTSVTNDSNQFEWVTGMRNDTDETRAITTANQVTHSIGNRFLLYCNYFPEFTQNIILPEGKGLSINQTSAAISGGVINIGILFELR